MGSILTKGIYPQITIKGVLGVPRNYNKKIYPSNPSNSQSVSISSSPVPMYRITCTCIFYAFLGALCSALF